MLLINRPFKIILKDYDFNEAGVNIIIALFCTACDSCTDCFHTLAMSIDDTSNKNLKTDLNEAKLSRFIFQDDTSHDVR